MSHTAQQPRSPPSSRNSTQRSTTADLSQTMASTKSTLLGLPVELQATILSHLSAGQIQRFRRVCSHFKSAIDEPSNHIIILQPGTAKLKRDIESSVNLLLNYPVDKPDSFVTALVNFCKHRGLHYQEGRRTAEVYAFADSWPRRNDRPECTFAQALGEIAFAITSLENIRHAQRLHEPAAALWVSPKDIHDMFPQDPAPELYLSTFHEWDVLYDKITSTVNPLFADCQHFTTGEGDLPLRYLTPISSVGFSSTTGEVFRRQQEPIMSTEQLANLFDLPSFTSHCFAYCAKTEWAYQRLKDARVRTTLGPIEKLAILEDLHFF